MDFNLSADQQALRDAARELLGREAPIALARSRYDDVAGAGIESLWRHVTEAGWTALTAPEDAGGLGSSVIELCLVLEEVGRRLAPIPLWESAGLAAALLRECGDRETLPRLAAGEIKATATVAEAGGSWFAAGQTTATSGRLTGTKCFVPEAQVADLLVVTADDDSVYVVDAAAADITPLDSLDRTEALCEVVFDGTPARLAGTGGVARALEEATVALAARSLGSARWMLDATVAYAKVREQFDVPIGSFQAVKHKCADMLLDWEKACAAVYYAAMCIAADDEDRSRAAHVAKATTNDAARHIAKDSIQLHGGIGFTWEHDLHLYIRRAYGDEPLLGGSEEHRARLAGLLAL